VTLLCLRLSLQVHGNEVIQIMSFMPNHVIHVKSCHSCQIMSFMSNHVIHVKSCPSCQIMSFMSNHAIHVKSCHSCQIISFMSNHFIHVKSCHLCQSLQLLLTGQENGSNRGQIGLPKPSATTSLSGRRQK
jgi:hypothetical protein